MALSLTLYQPYSPVYYLRGEFVYDPRGAAFPYLYSFSYIRYPDNASLWRLNRATGVLEEIEGDFNPWGTHGAPDLDAAGNLWWSGNEPGNLTFDRQAQTKFTHDTFSKIGSMTTNGVDIQYPVSGVVRVDRRTTGVVAGVELADIFYGRLRIWNGTTRVLMYDKAATHWVDRFIDYDFDGAGNVWVLSGGLTTTRLFKVDTSGTVTAIADLSGSMVQPFALKYLAADNSIIIANQLTTILKWDIVGAAISATLTTAIAIDKGQGEQQSFHHSLDSVTDVYLINGPFLHQIDLLNMVNGTVTDFTAARDAAGAIFGGFGQAYLAPTYKFNGGAAFYDPAGNAVWIEEVQSGALGKFGLGDVPPPPGPTTTCFDIFTITGQLYGTIHGTNLAGAYQVLIAPTDDPDDPAAYTAPITAVSDTAVTVTLPSVAIGSGFWFVFTDAYDVPLVSAGNNTLCNPVTLPTTTCIDIPSPAFNVPYGTIHGENLATTYKVLITQINNVYDGNAYNAPLLDVTDTSVTVFIPNHTIGEGYWWIFTTANGVEQITPGTNQLCSPLGLSYWKTRKVWFTSLEP